MTIFQPQCPKLSPGRAVFKRKTLHEVDFFTFFIFTNPQIHIKIQFSSSPPKPWKVSCLKFSILQSRFLKCSFSLSRFQTKKLHLEQKIYVHNQESRPREANVRSEMHLRCEKGLSGHRSELVDIFQGNISRIRGSNLDRVV